MASLIFKPTYRDKRTGTTVSSRKWYARIGGRRVPLGVTDKAVALRRASELLLEHESRGSAPRRAAKGTEALADHLATFEASLLAKGCTPAHVALTLARLRAVFAGVKAARLQDLANVDVAGWLAAQAMSAQTRKHHQSHLRQFGRYLEQRGICRNPFSAITVSVHVESDRRLQRRALTADEMRRLLESVARSRSKRCRMNGATRRVLYWLASTTALRRNELASLTRRSFDFSVVPVVCVESRHTKNRRAARLPLRADLAAELQTFLAGKRDDEVLFPIAKAATHRMIAADMADAGITAAIDGRRVDFHALRATAISGLGLAGVPLVVAQRIARHSTPTLTANAYSICPPSELQAAVERLPSFVDQPPE